MRLCKDRKDWGKTENSETSEVTLVAYRIEIAGARTDSESWQNFPSIAVLQYDCVKLILMIIRKLEILWICRTYELTHRVEK